MNCLAGTDTCSYASAAAGGTVSLATTAPQATGGPGFAGNLTGDAPGADRTA